MIISVIGMALSTIICSSFVFFSPYLPRETLIELWIGACWLSLLYTLTHALFAFSALEDSINMLRKILLFGCRGRDIYWSRVVVIFVFTGLIFLIASFVLAILFNLNIEQHFCNIVFSGFVALFGLVELGVLLSFLSSSISGREMLFPMLFFSFSLPLVCGGAACWRDFEIKELALSESVWFSLIIATSVIYGILSWWLCEVIIEE